MDNYFDNELVYLYRECYSQLAYNYLFERYHEKIMKMINKHVSTWRYMLPYEKEDIISFCYTVFDDVAKTFPYNQKKVNFDKYLINNIKYLILNYLRKFLTNKHRVLNYAICLDSKISQRYLDVDKSINIDQSLSDLDTYNQRKEWILSILEKINRNNKDIIYDYFFKGIKTDELCKKYNLEKNKIINILVVFKRKLKKEYQSCIYKL